MKANHSETQDTNKIKTAERVYKTGGLIMFAFFFVNAHVSMFFAKRVFNIHPFYFCSIIYLWEGVFKIYFEKKLSYKSVLWFVLSIVNIFGIHYGVFNSYFPDAPIIEWTL